MATKSQLCKQSSVPFCWLDGDTMTITIMYIMCTNKARFVVTQIVTVLVVIMCSFNSMAAALLLMLVLNRASVSAQYNRTTVKISIDWNPPGLPTCIGGITANDLTDTSVRVEYRLLDPGQWSRPSFEAEWMLWGSYDTTDMDSKKLGNRLPSQRTGIQFRVLQLEHGGGGCNCWKVEHFRFKLRSSNSTLNMLNNICHTHFRISPNTFCRGSGFQTRGFVSRAVYSDIDHATQIINVRECPGGTDRSLFFYTKPALPVNCGTNPRM